MTMKTEMKTKTRKKKIAAPPLAPNVCGSSRSRASARSVGAMTAG